MKKYLTGRYKSSGIQKKMAIILIAITTFILTLFGFYQYVELRTDITSELNYLAETAVERLAENLVFPVWQFNEKQIEKTILSEMKEQRIYAVLVNDKRELIKGKKRDNTGQITDSAKAISGDMIKKVKPIVKDGKKLGIVEIYITRKYMKEKLNKEIWKMCFTIMLLDFFLLVSIIIGVRKILVQPVIRIVDGLNESADQVSYASDQIASAGQSLAEGTSEQAASSEQIAASLEQVSAMARQNADNSGQANNLMGNLKQVVETVYYSMFDLTKSMDEISTATGEASGIIKNIDEIAFQTNLLALNAAVEAARAGENGAGFAVVADEVRNLALRAAEAAQNTSGLIQGITLKVEDGLKMVSGTSKSFNQVNTDSDNVADLVSNITVSSNDQAEGIEQVNNAVSEIDKVNQQNAANAEESASAHEELNAQAEYMKKLVDELVMLI